MNNELVQTGFFDVKELHDEGPIQVIYDYSRVTPEQADKLETIYNRMFMRHMRTAYEDGKDLLEAKQVKNLPYSEFIEWTQTCYGWGQTVVERKINGALYWGDFSPASGAKIDEKAIDALSTKRVPESARKEAKALLTTGISITENQAKEIRDRHKAEVEELKEAKQELQRSFDLFKDDRKKERQEHEDKLKAIENEKAAKEDEILKYKQLQATLGNVTQLKESLRSEARQQLDKDLDKQRQEQKAELKKKEKELKDTYTRKEQEYQLKAENTIRSLLSHGIKSMAETQLTIEHTVSSGMLQAVQQLGGKQVDSFIAQAESLQEEIGRVIAKLTHGDYLALEERISVNG